MSKKSYPPMKAEDYGCLAGLGVGVIVVGLIVVLVIVALVVSIKLLVGIL